MASKEQQESGCDRSEPRAMSPGKEGRGWVSWELMVRVRGSYGKALRQGGT